MALQDLSTLFQGIQGIMSIQTGADSSAGVFERQADLTRHVNKYNVSISQVNLARTLEAQAVAVRRNVSTIRAEAGGRGIDPTSKTFMAFANDQLTQFERSVQHQRLAQENVERVSEYQSESEARILEGRAAQVRASARRQTIAALPNLFGQVTGLFS